MQLERTCKQCETPLGDDKKLGAQYCNHSCSQGYYKRRKRILDQITKVESEIEFNDKWITELDKKSEALEKTIIDLSPIKQNIKANEKKLKTLNQLLRASKQVFRKSLESYLDRNMNNFGDDYSYFKFGDPKDQEEILLRHYSRFKKIRKETVEKVASLENELNKTKQTNDTIELDQISLFIKQIGIRSTIKELNRKLTELMAIDLDQLPPKYNPKKSSPTKPKTKPTAKGISGLDILNMSFNNLKLEGELGRFLGLLQRNKCAIALTGDSGAGKSTFSFQLAKAFINAQQSVGYFSLESGYTETTQEFIEKLNLQYSKIKIFEDGSLEDVRLQAEHLDCVIVDSYSKISSKATDFESLRQDFPNTFFIIIFQKTTGGKIRGGSSIEFNSTATIDIRLTKGEHRIAFMQKSRYGTENFVYSISLGVLLKDRKSPIKWSEIEENWPSPHHH